MHEIVILTLCAWNCVPTESHTVLVVATAAVVLLLLQEELCGSVVSPWSQQRSGMGFNPLFISPQVWGTFMNETHQCQPFWSSSDNTSDPDEETLLEKISTTVQPQTF